MDEKIIVKQYLHLTARPTRFRQPVLLTGLLLLSGLSNNLMAQDSPSYRFGAFPHMSSSHVEKKYAPVALAFSKLLNKPVRLGTATDMDKFRNRVIRGDFDIALIPPLDIVPIVDKGGYIPLARKPSNPATIVVSIDSALKQVEDLQGKTVGLPEGTPVSIILQLTLRERGFTGDKNIHFQDVKNVQACLHKLLLKLVDACGSPSGIGIGLKMFQNKMGRKFRVIMQTQAFPHMLFVAHPRLPLIDRERLTHAILGEDDSEQGQMIFQAIGIKTHFIPYESMDYEIIRQYRQRWMSHAKNSL